MGVTLFSLVNALDFVITCVGAFILWEERCKL